jgi:hypothetical protein
MGREKDLAIEQDEQGWSFSPGTRVCFRCLADPELVAFAKANSTEFECDFCERISKKHPISIAFDSLMEVVGGVVHQYYERAVDAMGWDGEDDTYVGTTYDSYEIVHDEFYNISDNEQVLQAIVDSLSDETWCDRSPYSTTGFEAYELSWEQFCKAVKHQTRFFFAHRGARDVHDSDLTPVSDMLAELGSMLESEDLIETVDVAKRFFRVRCHRPGEKCNDWKSLGSPPPTRAPSNRMSAAGISMFYGSTNLATAKTETLSTVTDRRSYAFTAAAWLPTRPLLMLNLCKIPATPSVWFTDRYYRDRIRFLRTFAESISQPVVHDGREHIDYVPTQILTEYFRHEYRRHDGKQIDGIIYPSARVPRGQNAVIFASQDDLIPTEDRMFRDTVPVLKLDAASLKRLRIRA